MPTSRVALGSPHVLLHAYRPLAERPGSYLAQVAGFSFLPFIHHCQGSFLQDRPTGIPMRRDDGATSSTIDAVRRIFYGLVRVSKIKLWFLYFHKTKRTIAAYWQDDSQITE